MHTTAGPHDLLGLPLGERIDLAQQLWDSVREEMEVAPLTGEQRAEVKRRIAAIDAGLVVCEPFDAVMRRLRGR